jgi:ABC-2 type transport system ATP-binding protein
MSIECFCLSKRFGAKNALDDISIEISEGKVTGLVGPNGAGKSTLIKLITGLIYPTDGFVRIDGYDVHAEHKLAMRRLGAIVEWPSFYPDLSARRNLAILTGAHGKKYEEKLEEVTTFLKINDVLDRKVGVFSTGMKQRLGIALALLPDSKYIILDEPTNGLDPAGIVEIRNLIRDCNRLAGVTVLVSSHLLSEVEMVCDEVIMIADGQLKAAGSLNELLGGVRQLRVVTGQLEKTAAFLEQAFQAKEPWITSAPENSDGSLLFSIPQDMDPAVVSSKLFEAGFSLSHFAGEQLSLERFFLQKTAGGEK